MLDELVRTVDRLRAQHVRTVQLVRDLLQDAKDTAERSAELRQELRRQRELLDRKADVEAEQQVGLQPPSSGIGASGGRPG